MPHTLAYTGPMRRLTLRATIAVLLIVQPVLAQKQTPLKPTVPGTSGDPAWQGTVRLSDGRTFITDGGLAVDVALARPPVVPKRELSAKVLENYLNASHKNE